MMKKLSLAACLAGVCAVFADPHKLENGTLTFDVDAADYPEATPYEYATSLSEAMSPGVWYLLLSDNGQALKFGAARGTQVILR